MHPKRARSLHGDLFSGAVVEKVRTSVMETRPVKRRDEKGKDEKEKRGKVGRRGVVGFWCVW